MNAPKKRSSGRKALANKKVKLHWEKMELTRVRLNPEQAVLSCCESNGRGNVTTGMLLQCELAVCETGGGDFSPAS